MSEAIKQPVSPEGIIQMQGVNKWYGQFHVLKDINLNVKQGERIVLCGPSGSGKSTTIRCLNRLEEHQQGRIVVDGVELTNDLKQIEAILALYRQELRETAANDNRKFGRSRGAEEYLQQSGKL